MRLETEELLAAMADYVAESTALQAKLDAHDGYSPDYHFAHDIAVRAKAAERFERAFDLAVLSVPLRGGR